MLSGFICGVLYGLFSGNSKINQRVKYIFLLVNVCLSNFKFINNKYLTIYLYKRGSLYQFKKLFFTFKLFKGQPLTLLGSTGPVLVFESILNDYSKENQIDYMGFRVSYIYFKTFFLKLF